MQHRDEGTSMPMPTARAGVNLAAVHDRGKVTPLEGVFRRRFDPLNAERLAALDRLEVETREAPTPAAAMNRAFLRPALARGADLASRGRASSRLHSQAYTEAARTVRARIGELLLARMARHGATPEDALPMLPRKELDLHTRSMSGTCACAFAATDPAPPTAGQKPEDRRHPKLLAERVVTRLAAGLRAPPAAHRKARAVA